MKKDKLSILVIDDEVTLQEIYTKFLEKLGATVDFYDHPQKAWRAIDKEEYDLIITDLKMPIISGDEFISIIRGSKLNAHTPIILCSGHINKVVITEVTRESKVYFLNKPFDSTALLDLVKKAVGVKHSESSANQAINEKWIQAFLQQLNSFSGDKVSVGQVDHFEVWNFETIGINFYITQEKEVLSVALLMKLDTFFKIAGKIQGTNYKEIEDENLDVWQHLLNNTFKVSGKVTFSKLISQEFINSPGHKTSFLKFNTSFGEVLVHLN